MKTTELLYLFLIISIQMGCQNDKQTEKKVKKDVQVSYWIDTDTNKSISNESIKIIFDIGFDETQHFKISLDDKLIKGFTGKTDNSIGRCCLEKNINKFCSVEINYEQIKNASELLVEINEEYIEIKIPKEIERYNRLFIGRGRIWEASFQYTLKSNQLE